MDRRLSVGGMTATLRQSADRTDDHRRIARQRNRHAEIRGFDPRTRAATRTRLPVRRQSPTSTPPPLLPPRPSPPTGPPRPSSAPSSSRPSPPTSKPSGETLDRPRRRRERSAGGPHHRRGRPHHRSAAAVRRACCARAAGTAPASTPRCPTVPRCPAPTSASASSRSARSRVFGASQLPAGLLGRRRRHRLGPGGRLPRGRQGPRRAPRHLRDSSARAITEAVADAGLPAGTFSLLFGSGPDLGIALVTDPRIKAVGFTGSRTARNGSGRRGGGPPRAHPGLRRDELHQPGVPARRRAEHPRRRTRQGVRRRR